MSWSAFIQSLEAFFTSVGQTFLTNIKTAYPALEQAAMNFLVVIADAIIAGIESGAIPLPVLASEPGTVVDTLALGRTKQLTAFNAIQEKLKITPPPAEMVITTSLINSAIEISVQKHKQLGNQGNFPGGNSNEAK